MVLAVCRRLLRNDHAAEDAFQATFLVLVRKAGALRWQESIAGWLHEVACRTARKARSRPVSLPLPENTMDRSTAVASDSDLREVLDEALVSLPGRYRTPLVLCCCEGKSNEQAAKALGCALGTVKSRLSRGRELLRKRLLRRGVAVPVAGLTATLAAGPLNAGPLPPLMLRSTVEQALSFAGGTAAGSSSTVLAGTILRGFWLAKMGMIFGLLTCGALMLTAVGYGLGFFDANAPLAQVPVVKLAAGQFKDDKNGDVPGKRSKGEAQPLAPTKKAATETAWGDAVDGVQYGVEFKDKRNRYAIGDDVTFVLKARNVTDKPASFDQVQILNFSTVWAGNGSRGVVLPKVIDAKGKETKVFEGTIPPIIIRAKVRKIKIAPKETTVLGKVTFCVGPNKNEGAYIDAVPGTYGVRFDTVCWLPGHKRPTGTLEMVVFKPGILELYEKLKLDMTRKEVEAILGKPIFPDLKQPNGEVNAYYLGYEYAERAPLKNESPYLPSGIKVTYVADKLTKKLYNPQWVKQPAWGKAVDGIQFGFEFKDHDFPYRFQVGDHVTFVFKAHNTNDKPVRFEQVEITEGVRKTANGKQGVIVPKVLDSNNKEVQVQGMWQSEPGLAKVRTVEIAANETASLGQITCAIGPNPAMVSIHAGPGRYKVRFDTVCWLPGHIRPTGTLEMVVEKAASEGKAGKGDDAKKPPSPLPEDLVAAWKKAGGEASWVIPGVSTYPLVFHKGEVFLIGEMPAFIFKEWPLGVIGGLPQPDRGYCLSFKGTGKTDAGLKELAGLKTLEALDLQASDVSDAGLKELAGLKSLHALYLGTTQVTDAGLKNLAGLTNLETLDLGATQVTGVGLKDLAGLKSLRTLYLRYDNLTDAGLKELAELQSLQTLGIENTKLTDARLKELARLKSLQSLNLMDIQVTDAGLKELAGMKGLRSLTLLGAQVTDAGLKALARLKGLQELNLSSIQVTDAGLTDAGLKELAGLNELQSLLLRSPQVTDAGLKELAALKSLENLQLYDTKVTGAGMKVLPRLRVVGISGPNVTDATVKELARLESLETLSLDCRGGTHVTDFGLKELAGFRNLQDLMLNSTHVTDAGLKELAGHKSLRQLILTNTKVTDAGIAELQKALPACRIEKGKDVEASRAP